MRLQAGMRTMGFLTGVGEVFIGLAEQRFLAVCALGFLLSSGLQRLSMDEQ